MITVRPHDRFATKRDIAMPRDVAIAGLVDAHESFNQTEIARNNHPKSKWLREAAFHQCLVLAWWQRLLRVPPSQPFEV